MAAPQRSGTAHGYVPGVDGLRALAVMAVMGTHIALLRNIRTRFLDGGATGVSVFFVISGFLITSLMLREHDRDGSVDKRAFWLRRARRLFPSLAVLLVAATSYDLIGATGSARFGIGGLASVVGYVSNWYLVFSKYHGGLGVLSHAWSLAIEEQFYIVWPFFMAAVVGQATRRRWLLHFVAAAAAVSFLLRVVLWVHGGVPAAQRIYYGSDTNAETLLWGCGLAVIANRHPERIRPIASGALLGGVALLLLLEVPVPPIASSPTVLELRYIFGPTVIGIATCCLIAALLLNRPVTQFLNFAPLVWVGKLSYDLYLWHYVVVISAANAGVRSPWMLLLLVVGVAGPVSFATYQLTRATRRSSGRLPDSSALWSGEPPPAQPATR
jgi:peptidoglycan/LPS O-acetylase OafA/YrhL